MGHNTSLQLQKNTPMMNITVKSPTATISLDVAPTTLVRELKQHLCMRSNIQKDLVRLFHAGKQLEDEKTLKYSGIIDRSTMSAFVFSQSQDKGVASLSSSTAPPAAVKTFSFFENPYLASSPPLNECCDSSWRETKSTVFIFADKSNISISAQYLDPSTLSSADGAVVVRDTSVRLAVAALDKLVVGNRQVTLKHYFGASSLVGASSDAAEWEACGYQRSKKPVVDRDVQDSAGDDNAVVAQVLHIILENKENPVGKTIVLLTGDGCKKVEGASFPDVVNLALEAGFGVEVWTWKASCSRAYRDLENSSHGGSGRFSLRFIDSHRDEVTVHSAREVPESAQIVAVASDGNSCASGLASVARAQPRAEATPVVVATPVRRVPCQNGPSCIHLQRGRCTFIHTPAEVAAARSGQVKPGHWTCGHCSFLNRPSNTICGGTSTTRGGRKLGCGASVSVNMANLLQKRPMSAQYGALETFL